MNVLFESQLTSLKRLHRGKVRENYAIDDQTMLIVASDRVSAFDFVLDQPIPEKGMILTQLAQFWFNILSDIVPNHLTALKPEDVVSKEELDQVIGRSMVVKRLKPLPIEAVVRGYLIGSGWKDYQSSGQVCGITLPSGLKQASKLSQPIFTPATKAAVGEHDENISFVEMSKLIGKDMAIRVRDVSIKLYEKASEYAARQGIIIADTKFEFGLDENGTLTLMDEVLTPDSSRFWPADQYQEGCSPPSYDKQFIRDYLNSLKDWNKALPVPPLTEEVIDKTFQKYCRAYEVLTDQAWLGY